MSEGKTDVLVHTHSIYLFPRGFLKQPHNAHLEIDFICIDHPSPDPDPSTALQLPCCSRFCCAFSLQSTFGLCAIEWL